MSKYKGNITSAAGGLVLEILTDKGGDVWIESAGRYSSGCFSKAGIKTAINTLAESIGKVATLTDQVPVLTFGDLAFGTVFRFRGYAFKLVKLDDNMVWNANAKQHFTQLGGRNTPVVVIDDE